MPIRAHIVVRVSLLVIAFCGGSAVMWSVGPGGGTWFYAALPVAFVAAALLTRLADSVLPAPCPACGERMRPPSRGRRLKRNVWLCCPKCGQEIAAD